jgi:hypothetical protein
MKKDQSRRYDRNSFSNISKLEKSWKIGKLPLEEQMKYPEKGIYNLAGFIDAVETGMIFNRDLC